MKDVETFASVQSSEDTPHDEAFVARLRILIAEHRSVRSFANAVGVGDSVIRKYLGGSTPSIDKAVAIADGAGVNLEWLAAGRGEMRPAGLQDRQQQASYEADQGTDASKGPNRDQRRIFARMKDSGEKVQAALDQLGWQKSPVAIVDAFKTLTLIYNVTQDDLADALGMIKSEWDKLK